MILKFFYQNVRGLRGKTGLFLRNLLLSDYDIICLSETWLLPGIFDSELFDSRYGVYRTDRDYESHGTTMGGGTLIAVRHGLSVDMRTMRPLPSLADTEITSVRINLDQSRSPRNLCIFCCYFLQSKNQEASEHKFFSYISDLGLDSPNDEYIIVGDFNIREASWSPGSGPGLLLVAPIGTNLLHNFMTFYHMWDGRNTTTLVIIIIGTWTL